MSAEASSWLRPPRLRSADEAEDERHATWLELFFDLVIVVAVSQLAQRLRHDPSASDLLIFLGLFFPIAWVWMGFTFYANRFDTDDVVYRAVQSLGMLGVAALAVSVPHATTSGGSVGFALSYVSIRLATILLYARAVRYAEGQGRRFVRVYLTGFSVGASLWLVSVFVPTPWRFWLWGVGLAVDLAMPVIGWRLLGRVPLQIPHLTERFGLFFIIVLGETVAGVVFGTRGVHFTLHTSLVGIACFAGSVCMWWIYFDLADTSVVGRGMMGLVYVWGHVPLLAGVAAFGAGTRLAIQSASDAGLGAGIRWALCAGVAAFLLSLALIHLVAEWTSPRDRAFIGRLVLAGLLLVLAGLGGGLDPLAFCALLTAGLAAQLLLEALTPATGAASVWDPSMAGSAAS